MSASYYDSRPEAVAMHSNLVTTFTVLVILDGDDYPPTQIENARAALESAVAQMETDGLIRSGGVA